MNRIINIVFLVFAFTVSAFAVSVTDVAGEFNGSLNIGGTPYNNKTVYILPGVASNTITFVLPDFKYNKASLGDIVLVNIPMNSSGKLTLDNASLYIKAISERATISVLNGFKDGNDTYNSIVSASSAQVLLSIAAPSLPEPILVLFNGSRVTDANYAITNGGFEGTWSNGELEGWHSFNSATGSKVSFVKNTEQFIRSTDKRPGSSGSQSAMIKTKIILGNNANGNCTNGQINAGSTTADDASGNYNFSDPSNKGYNTAFVGNPDSLVFWAKYIPADKKPGNSVNKARAHCVITTNARYQDPEAVSYASVKVADAALNYSATSSMGWQRLSIPFVYTSVNPSSAAYMLITFSSNYTPGGGSAYNEGGGLFSSGTDYLDNVYLDDVEMIYNHALTSLNMNGTAISFTNGNAVSTKDFSDSDYNFVATTNGKAAKSFIGYDAVNSRVYVYVVAHNYSQAKSYSVYTLQMATPVKDTEYAYSATICSNESYSDNLFSKLTKAGSYTTKIPNSKGGDSIVTLTLNVLPAYEKTTKATINMNETYDWRGTTYSNLKPGLFTDQVELKTKAGCDSVFTLALTVKPIAYELSETLVACQNEEAMWHGKLLPTAKAGTVMVYDSLKSVYNMDSVIILTLQVKPSYTIAKTVYLNEVDTIWRGQHISGLAKSDKPYMFYDSLTAQNGCDSVYVLTLYISDKPVTYGVYQATICDGDNITFDGIRYEEAFDDDVRFSQPNMYGGDSVIHLLVDILPSYFIEEYRTITVGDNQTWEYFNLNAMPVGEMMLNASYYSVDDCDSTMVLYLTVLPEHIVSGMENVQDDARTNRKVIINGQLYIIRKDETIYDILGKKVK